MKLDEYQTGAVETAIYPGTLLYPALGLAGECSELSRACTKEDVEKEIGDILWYVANVANDAEFKLSEVMKAKTFNFRPEPQWDRDDAMLAIFEQVGIVAENIKKAFRDNAGVLTDVRRDDISKALRKVMKALAFIADINFYTLQSCAEMNNFKLASRAERGKLKGDGDDR